MSRQKLSVAISSASYRIIPLLRAFNTVQSAQREQRIQNSTYGASPEQRNPILIS